MRCGISRFMDRMPSGWCRAVSESISIASGTNSLPIRKNLMKHHAHYAKLYAQPGAMHAGFEQFKAFDQDATDNKAFVAKGMLTMPVLAVGGEKSFGPMMATVMRAAATNVQGAVVPNSGHWVMEENPAATIKLVEDFLH